MIDRIFIAVLTFCLLAGGTLAIGSAMFGVDHRSVAAQASRAPVKVLQLETVTIVGKRLAPATTVAHTPASEPDARRVE